MVYESEIYIAKNIKYLKELTENNGPEQFRALLSNSAECDLNSHSWVRE